MTLPQMIQHLFNAVALGSLYGLIAIGYTMVYGILRLINFAHGDMFMLGAYFVFFTTVAFMPAGVACFFIAVAIYVIYGILRGFRRRPSLLPLSGVIGFVLSGLYFTAVKPVSFQLPWPAALVLAIAATSFCGVVVDRIAYRPLRDAPRISALISAIGISFFIESLSVVLFTGLPRPVLQPEWLMTPITFSLGAEKTADSLVRILPLSLLVPCITAGLVLGLLFIIHRTKPGLAMRAISRDIETTRLMGVSVDKIIALTFALGSALAAASGIMWALRYPQIQPYMGITPGLKAFIAAVFGGIGSIPGAMVGGILLGGMEILLIAVFPQLSGYRDAFAFTLLIAILLVKPTGLFGAKLEDKI
ncbi:MAG: branched-chain amino acid ABC transporter permease [Deltaproteobacteria bacterium]|nr:branched-chain amino acid ABC transporter permease [Deltaproteobacteria bacterium]